MVFLRLSKPSCILCLSLFFPLNSVICENERAPFSTLEVGVGYLTNANHNRFHEFYETGSGIEASVRTPFYYGDLQVALQSVSFSTRSEEAAQDFNTIGADIRWGPSLALPYRLSAAVGFGAGFYAFLPDNPSLGGFAHHTETELSAALFAQLRYPLTQKWALNTELTLTRLFTFRHIDLAYVSMGLAYRFSTPCWLRTFLE